MTTKNRKGNPPGLPAWPDVDDASLGVVIVSGKAKDPDVLETRTRKIYALAMLPLFIIVIVLMVVAIKKGNGFHRIISMWNNDFENAVICLAGGVFFLGCGLMVLHAIFLSIVRLVSVIVSFWFRPSVLLKFTKRGLEISNFREDRRFCDLTKISDINLEFHARNHPRQVKPVECDSWNDRLDRLLDAHSQFKGTYTVNFMYGGEEIRLFSTYKEKRANDFVRCCVWAEQKIWRGKTTSEASVAHGVSAASANPAVNDLD